MTWDQFTDVLPVLTLIVGYAGSQFSDRIRERRSRERIVLQRAADVEGDALLELQDLLIALPHDWLDVLTRWDEYAERGGELDPQGAYAETVKIGQPYRRAALLASRIVDDALREQVQSAIELAYPFRFREISRMLGGFEHDLEEYSHDAALAAVAEATEAIGSRLRQPARDRGGHTR